MRLITIVLATALFLAPAYAGVWDETRLGRWLPDDDPVLGDVVLARGELVCEIVVSAIEDSVVHTAAGFLAKDITQICGVEPRIVQTKSGGIPAIHLCTMGDEKIPNQIKESLVAGAWEEYVVSIGGSEVWLVGSNPRGTAFASYELSERMGIDPLYHWTGYKPDKRNPLALYSGFFIRSGPAFKYRGMYHGEIDILPTAVDDQGYPLMTGVVDTQWYERWFETALRLKCNMVAPYSRIERRFEIQQLASDWGLFFTGHHNDTLLSNPWGYERFGLADVRGVEGSYDWAENKYGMLDYWEGGVVENRKLDCIWPVGLHATNDVGHAWAEGITPAQMNAAYSEATGIQTAMANTILEADKPRLFHFTLHGEMLQAYQDGGLVVPDDVIIVWDDDGNGVMRGLPGENDLHPHGVNYHLSYLGAKGSKQGAAHTISPERIVGEFQKIVAAGATEFLLVNVSELRDVVLETRMVMDIAWRPKAAFNDEKHGSGYIGWCSQEYFPDNADRAADAYREYYRLLPSWEWQWHGSEQIELALRELQKKFAGEEFTPPDLLDYKALVQREWDLKQGLKACDKGTSDLGETRRQFFYENVYLALLIEYRHTACAVKLNEALLEQDSEKAWVMVQESIGPLTILEEEILKAERPPFEGWYKPTWIRHRSSEQNIHRPYSQLEELLTSKENQNESEED